MEKNWLDFIGKQAYNASLSGTQAYFQQQFLPTPSNLNKGVYKEYEDLVSADKDIREYDRLLRTGQTKEALKAAQDGFQFGERTPRLFKEDAPEQERDLVEEYHNQYIASHLDAVDYSTQNVRDYLGGFYKYLSDQYEIDAPSMETGQRFEDNFYNNTKIPYFTVFGKEKREAVKERQRAFAEQMGKVSISPYPTRSRTGRILYGVQREEFTPDELGESGFERYAEIAEYKSRAFFDHEMSHDVFMNWYDEQDQYAKAFPPDPEFSWQKYPQVFEQITENLPSEMVDRILESNSLAEALAAKEGFTNATSFRSAYEGYFSEVTIPGTDIKVRPGEFAMDMSIGFADPAGLAVGAITGGAGSIAGRKLLGQAGAKALAGRAILDGGLGALEGTAYALMYAENSDPLQQPADWKTAAGTGMLLGTAFELGFGEVASDAFSKRMANVRQRFGRSVELADQLDNASKDAADGATRAAQIMNPDVSPQTLLDQADAAAGVRRASTFIGPVQPGRTIPLDVDTGDLPLVDPTLAGPRLAIEDFMTPFEQSIIRDAVEKGILDETDGRVKLHEANAIVNAIEEGYNFDDLVKILGEPSDQERTRLKTVLAEYDEDVRPYSQRIVHRVLGVGDYKKAINIIPTRKLVNAITIASNPDLDTFKRTELVAEALGIRPFLTKLLSDGYVSNVTPLELIRFANVYNLPTDLDARPTLRSQPLFDNLGLLDDNGGLANIRGVQALREYIGEIERKAKVKRFEDTHDAENLAVLGDYREVHVILGALGNDPNSSPIVLKAIDLLEKDETLSVDDALDQAIKSYENSLVRPVSIENALFPNLFDQPRGLHFAYYEFENVPELKAILDRVTVPDTIGNLGENVSLERALAAFASKLRALEAQIANGDITITPDELDLLQDLNDGSTTEVTTLLSKVIDIASTTEGSKVVRKIYKRNRLTLDDQNLLANNGVDLNIYPIEFVRHIAADALRIDLDIPLIPRPEYGKPILSRPVDATITALREYSDWYRSQPDATKRLVAAIKEFGIRKKKNAYVRTVLRNAARLLGTRDTLNKELLKLEANLRDQTLVSADLTRERFRLQSYYRNLLSDVDEALTDLGKSVGVVFTNPAAFLAFQREIGANDLFVSQARRVVDEALQGRYVDKTGRVVEGPDPSKAGFISLELLLGPVESLVKGLKSVFKNVTKLDPRNLSKNHRERKAQIRRQILESLLQEVTREFMRPGAQSKYINSFAEELATKYKLPTKETKKALKRIFKNRTQTGKKGKKPILWDAFDPLDSIFNPLLDRKTLFSTNALKETLKDIDAFIKSIYENKYKTDLVDSEYFDFDYDAADDQMLMDRLGRVTDLLDKIENLNINEVLGDETTPELDRVYDAVGIDPANETRYNIFRYRARLAGMSGNILAPESFKDIISKKLVDKLHYIPLDVITRDIPHFDDFDFTLYHKAIFQNFFPYASDLALHGALGGNITFGYIADALTRGSSVRNFLDQFGFLVGTPHRTVIVEVEKLLQELQDLSLTRKPEKGDIEAILGPIGPTGLPKKLEDVLLPSSRQDGWKRWIANVQEIMGMVSLEYPKERARFFKRKAETLTFLINNPDEFNLDTDAVNSLIPERNYYLDQYKKNRGLVNNPLAKDIYAQLDDLVTRYAEFFDESVKDWSNTFDLETSKSVIEDQVKRISDNINNIARSLENKDDEFSQELSTNLKKAVNQVHLLAGLEEPHLDATVDYRRLELLRSAPFESFQLPIAAAQQIRYELNGFLKEMADQFPKGQYPEDLKPTVALVQEFITDLQRASIRFLGSTKNLEFESNAALRTRFDSLELTLANLKNRFSLLVGSDAYTKLPDEIKEIIDTALDHYVENTTSLFTKLKFEGFGQPVEKVKFTAFDPTVDIDTRIRFKVERVMNNMGDLNSTQQLKDFLTRNKAFTVSKPVVAKFLKMAMDFDELGVGEVKDLLKTFAKEVDDDTVADRLYQFFDEELYDVESEYTLRERLDNILDPPDGFEGGGTNTGPFNPKSGRIDIGSFLALPFKGVAKGYTVIRDLLRAIGDRLHLFGSEIGVMYKGAINNERVKGKGLASYWSRPGGVEVKNLAEWLVNFGSDIQFTAFGRSLKEMNVFRSARSRAGANELGVIRALGRMIFGSDLFEMENGKVYNGGDHHANKNSTRFGLVKYRARMLGSFLTKVDRLGKKQKYIIKTLGVSEERFNELMGMLYDVMNHQRMLELQAGMKFRQEAQLPTVDSLYQQMSSFETVADFLGFFEDLQIDIPEEFQIGTQEGLNNLNLVLEHMANIERIKKSLSRSLPDNHPLKAPLDTGQNLVMISQGSLIDFDRILKEGELERIISDSLDLTSNFEIVITEPLRKVVGYLVTAEIRSGNLSIFGQINLLDGLRTMRRGDLEKLLKRHFDKNKIIEAIPELAKDQYAGLNEYSLQQTILDELVPRGLGSTFESVKTNIKSLYRNAVRTSTGYISSTEIAITRLIEAGALNEEDAAIARSVADKGLKSISGDTRTRYDNEIQPLILTEAGKLNAGFVGSNIQRSMLDNVRDMLQKARQGTVTISGIKLGFGITPKVLEKLTKYYDFEIVKNPAGEIDFDATLNNIMKVVSNFKNPSQFDDFAKKLHQDITGIKFDKKKNFTSQEQQDMVRASSVKRPFIKINVDTQKEHKASINPLITKNEEYKRIKGRGRVARKINSADTEIENLTLADFATAYGLEDLEYQGRKVIDASLEADFLDEINQRIRWAGLEDTFETIPQFFSYIKSQLGVLVKSGKVTNVKEALVMLEYMESVLTGKTRNNLPRYAGDFIRLMQKGANAAATAGFGIPATVELGVAIARNAKRAIFSQIPFISQILDGTQRIENFEKEIAAKRKQIQQIIKRKKKKYTELDEILKLEEEIKVLEKKHELTLDIIYGAGVGTEGALFRNTGSNRSGLIFDEKNPLVSAAFQDPDIGKKSVGRKFIEKIDKTLEKATEEAAEGNLLPLVPGTATLRKFAEDKPWIPSVGKYLSLNFITRKTQEFVFNSFVTKLIRQIDRLDIDPDALLKDISLDERRVILNKIIPPLVQKQLGITVDGLLRFVLTTKRALRDNPPRKKHGFTYYDIGSIFHHPAVSSANRHLIVSTIYNWIGQNVTRPDAGDLPLVMSNQYLQIISQFRSFGVAMFQKMMMPLAQRALGPGKLLSRDRGGAAVAVAAIGLMNMAYALLQYAMYNPEEVKQDMENMGTGEDPLTPVDNLLYGVLRGQMGFLDFGADLFHTMTGIQDPTSWYESEYNHRDQAAIDTAGGIAAYRFYRDILGATAGNVKDVVKGMMDEDIRQSMEEEFNYTDGNVANPVDFYRKVRAGAQPAGVKAKDFDKNLQRLTGNYKLWKLLEAFTVMTEAEDSY